MQIKCGYCGSMIEETADKCPFCGATNNAVKRTADKTPKTIAELQQWYQDRHLPPYETTRFFIGINYKKPKAFGIWRPVHCIQKQGKRRTCHPLSGHG